jgi:hypothetical protein
MRESRKNRANRESSATACAASNFVCAQEEIRRADFMSTLPK